MSREPFEEMYAAAGRDLAAIPWAALAPDPFLTAWLASPAAPPPGRALVVGCGLGDDAEALAARGHRVDAFDLSPTAIVRCRERFPGSEVAYRVADVLALPPGWRGAFDLVVEIRTLQSVERADLPAVVAAVAALPAPGGRLFVRCLSRDDDEPVGGRPWPLSPSDLAGFPAAGLVVEDEPAPRGGRTRTIVYRRPPARTP